MFKSAINRVLLFVSSLTLLIFTLFTAGAAHERITTKITFNKEIVRILGKSCMGCHREGGIAPMALTTYAEVRPWAKAIKEEVLERRMPPWHAVRGYGEFANDPSLSSRDLDLIVAWVEGGAPKGEEKDLPPLPDFAQEWPLGEPDLILKPTDPFHVAADGYDDYRCFVLRNPSNEDRYVRGVDLRPGDPSVVHHAFIWIDKSGKSDQLEAEDKAPGYTCFGGPRVAPEGDLGGWVPGQQSTFLPPGIAYLLPGGSRLVMQVHYHKSGSETSDLTQVGIYYNREAVKKRLRSIPIVNTRFEIPPGEPAFRVTASYVIPRDAEAVSVVPHMHLLGRSIEVSAHRPDGTREVLVWVREYDFDWQRTYTFLKPVPLPRGSRIEVTAYYDNSDRNPRNPNRPPKTVRWGDSTADEMCVAYLTYVLQDESNQTSSGR